MEITLRGIGASPGIAIGPALIFNFDKFDVPTYKVADTDQELARLERAIEAARAELQGLYEQTVAGLGEAHGGIFNAHLMLLDDIAIREEMARAIQEKRVNAEHVVDELAKRYAATMEAVNDSIFRERAADLLDVADRVLRHLLDAKRPDLKHLSQPSIIVAHDLSPSNTATMDVEHTLGIVVDSGSLTSHTAILARALEVPAVMGLSLLSKHIEQGVNLVVDGSEGTVVVRPTPETLERFEAARQRFVKQREALRAAVEPGPCHTQDGVSIPTYSNIELPIEVGASLKAFACGVGLYRTEYLFLNRATLPSEDEQYEAYAEVARAMEGRPVTLRTIDLGGDKFVSHLHFAKDENPQLGWRAVRFCLARPDIFKVQLRAILRATVAGNVEIMFPMISGLEELREVKAVLREVQEDLTREGIPFNPDMKVGCMIEVPSAVALTDVLARESDFFSIGTNDLIQYSLAVDRVNEKIAHLYEPAHPAVMRMIKWIANAARNNGIPCSLCGEMAGDQMYTEVLLGLGVSALSMSAVSLPAIRAEVSRINMEEAQALAQDVLKMSTAEEIKQRLRRRFEDNGGLAGFATPYHGQEHPGG